MSHEEYIRIQSDDGRNVVERMINDLEKKADKGRVDFGLDIEIERVTDNITLSKESESDDTPGFEG